MLRLRQLPDNCTSEEFSNRITVAIRDHLPYLTRPFVAGNGSLGDWVIEQLTAVFEGG